jgi:hypothetical protein
MKQRVVLHDQTYHIILPKDDRKLGVQRSYSTHGRGGVKQFYYFCKTEKTLSFCTHQCNISGHFGLDTFFEYAKTDLYVNDLYVNDRTGTVLHSESQIL